MPAVKREVRMLSGAQLRAKADKPGAEGYAAVFNEVADLGWFKETIKPGAFRRAISEKQDVRALMNHDENLILGRTKSNSLTLKEDGKGLNFDCDFPDTQAAKDLHTLMLRGDIDQCSFGFIVREQTWRQIKLDDGTSDEIREIEDLDLMDVSIVTFPAYEATSCEARALWPDGLPVEVRAHRHETRNFLCQCECPECEDGDCAECSNEECDDPNCEGERGQARRPAPPKRADDKKTRRVDGEDLTSDCFLIVGDESDTSTWKLPWKFSTDEKTKSHLRNALARFNQLKDVGQDVKDKAWKKLVKLCKEYDIEVSDEENKSQAHPLTRAQLDDLAEARDQANLEETFLLALADIRESVEEVTQAIAGFLERSAKRQKEISGPSQPDLESERARALVRAIAATL